jgi:hypothetical protein
MFDTSTGENNMAAPAVATDFTSKNSIDISKMMTGARLLYTTFHMGLGNLRQISVKAETTADPSQLRNQKKLIDCPELDEIRSQDAKLRRYAESKSCRYTGQEGVLIIADGMIPVVDRVLVAYEMIRRPALVEKFMTRYTAEYESDFQQTRMALGDQFNKRDYSHPDVVRAGFSFRYGYMDIQTTGTINIADPNIRQREERKQAAVIAQAAQDLRDTMRAAGAQMVEALFDVLKPEQGVRKVLRGQLDRLQEYIDTYNLRDVTNDVQYQQHIDTLRQIMNGVSVDKLRESDSLKLKIATELETLRPQLKALVSSVGRKFRTEN